MNCGSEYIAVQNKNVADKLYQAWLDAMNFVARFAVVSRGCM